MSGIFMKVLNMSLMAGYCIVAVILVRFILRRQPKIFSYLLWSVALFRLLCPVSISSPYSLLRMDTTMISQERIERQLAFDAAAGQGAIRTDADGGQGMEQDGVEPLPTDAQIKAARIRTLIAAGAWIWAGGFLVLGVYGAVSVLRLRSSLQKAVPAAENLYELEGISTPFAFGLVRPRIYLPVGLAEEERRYVLEHERIHIARKDPLIKVIAWTAACIHWFNPLVWLAFVLMERDMEMSCDEAVLGKLGEDAKEGYSRALLSLSCDKRGISGCPLAFGEGEVKNRILHIFTYRRKTFAVALAAGIILVIVALGLSLNPVSGTGQKDKEEITAFATEYANAFVGRDGDALVGLYPDEETAFENETMLEKEGDVYLFGYSSPWPIEYRLTIDEEGQKAHIRYYAWTSDPHVIVWEEELSFIETEEGYRVTDSFVKMFDSISSREEFEEAYLVSGEYQFVDYAEMGYVETINYQTEYGRENGDETDWNAVYRNPGAAAEYILNLTGKRSEVSDGSDSHHVVVKYMFADGSSIDIPMYNANAERELGSAAERPTENREEDAVWIVDVDAWNGKAP